MHPNVKALIEREYAAQKSEEWLALRGNMLTASDAAITTITYSFEVSRVISISGVAAALFLTIPPIREQGVIECQRNDEVVSWPDWRTFEDQHISPN